MQTQQPTRPTIEFDPEFWKVFTIGYGNIGDTNTPCNIETLWYHPLNCSEAIVVIYQSVGFGSVSIGLANLKDINDYFDDYRKCVAENNTYGADCASFGLTVIEYLTIPQPLGKHEKSTQKEIAEASPWLPEKLSHDAHYVQEVTNFYSEYTTQWLTAVLNHAAELSKKWHRRLWRK